MTISFALFFGLLFLSIVPPYLFSLYLMYTLRQVSISITKLLEQEAMHAAGGSKTLPLFTTKMSKEEMLDLIKKSDRKDDLQSTSTPTATGGHYL